MRTGAYTISELFGSRHVEQLVIPEIQRDYVWSAAHVRRLMESITKNFANWRRDIGDPPMKIAAQEGGALTAEQTALQKDFAAFYSKRTHSTNVGFVYAYCDADLPGQHFLIDGQQRLTTIYLALLAVGARTTNLADRFRARYLLRKNGGAAPVPTRLDYRLREHTADFLHRMVDFLLKNPDAAGELQKQAWFLAEATRDTTSCNLVKNYQEIRNYLQPTLAVHEAVDLYDYLENLVDCWYFDTNESAQGEELYLYLNARGEAITDNENQKANLLKGLISKEEKNKWGRKWEEWQDHFWSHRQEGLLEKEENPNADRGFNSFLKCIESLSELCGHGSSTSLQQLQFLDQQVAIVRWLKDQKAIFKNQFGHYTSWVDRWFHEFWKAFNDKSAATWKAPADKEENERDQKLKTLVWGTLLCAFTALEKTGWLQGQADPAELSTAMKRVDPTTLFRAIRVFFLRYYNNARTPKTLPKLAAIVLAENTDDVGDDLKEAQEKWRYLKKLSEDDRRKVESVIWQIEDHRFNLNADRLGGLNLTHLVDLSQPDTNLCKLERIRDVFYRLFPAEEKYPKNKELALILICYGAFWDKEKPFYYQNFNFRNWEKTVRGKGSAEAAGREPGVFRRFLDDFLAADESLDSFLKRKQTEALSLPIDPATETEFHRAVLWYSLRLKEEIFRYGMYVTEGKIHEPDPDVHFTKLRGLWNTGGGFQGNQHTSLASRLTQQPKSA